MDRRTFLQNAAVGSGVLTLVGGMWARRAYASHQLGQKLVAGALPILTEKAHTEFQSIPARGREEIRQWFHGKVLNVAPFVEEVCSNAYREKLHALQTVDEQQKLLLVSFCGRVATDAEILTRVQVIAEEIGQELDLHWGDCCNSIASQWNVHIKDYGQPLDLSELTGRVDQMVKQHLNHSLEMARVGAEYPALGETIGNIGKSALLVLPMTHITVDHFFGQYDFNVLAIPTFILLSLKHVFDYIIGLFSNPRPDLQRAISSQISLLGNRVGSDFESEVRSRLGALHGWQEQSLTQAAHHYAKSVVGWL